MSTSTSESLDSSPSTPFIQIKKWNLVALWKWQGGSDICAICRAHVSEACLTCLSENKECVIVWGQCNHSFHDCCMDRWIQQSNRCPLCQQDWKNCRSHQLK